MALFALHIFCKQPQCNNIGLFVMRKLPTTAKFKVQHHPQQPHQPHRSHMCAYTALKPASGRPPRLLLPTTQCEEQAAAGPRCSTRLRTALHLGWTNRWRPGSLVGFVASLIEVLGVAQVELLRCRLLETPLRWLSAKGGRWTLLQMGLEGSKESAMMCAWCYL